MLRLCYFHDLERAVLCHRTHSNFTMLVSQVHLYALRCDGMSFTTWLSHISPFPSTFDTLPLCTDHLSSQKRVPHSGVRQWDSISTSMSLHSPKRYVFLFTAFGKANSLYASLCTISIKSLFVHFSSFDIRLWSTWSHIQHEWPIRRPGVLRTLLLWFSQSLASNESFHSLIKTGLTKF